MEEETRFSWSNIGDREFQNYLVKRIENLNILMRDYKLEIQNSIGLLNLAINELRSDVIRIERDTKDYMTLFAMNQNSQPIRPIPDERDISSFMSLDELEIDEQVRKEKDELPVVEFDLKIVEDGFTAPPPKREWGIGTPVSEETDVSERELATRIMANLILELDASQTPVMNFSLQKRGILAEGYKPSKKVKDILKELVNDDESLLELHKFDNMRGMYYDPDELGFDETPQDYYDRIFSKSE